MRLLPIEGGSRLFLFIEKLHRLIESSPRTSETSKHRNLETSARRLVDFSKKTLSLTGFCVRAQSFAGESLFHHCC